MILGKRVEVKGGYFLKEGEYAKVDGCWMCVPPRKPDLLANLIRHQVIEHEDGTMGAAEGSNDDSVMAAAHAFYVMDRASRIITDVPNWNTSKLTVDPFTLDSIINELTGSRKNAIFKDYN